MKTVLVGVVAVPLGLWLVYTAITPVIGVALAIVKGLGGG